MNYAYEFTLDQNLYQEENQQSYNNHFSNHYDTNNYDNGNTFGFNQLLGFKGLNMLLFFLFLHSYFRENLFYILTVRFLRYHAYRSSLFMIKNVIYPLFIGDVEEEDEDEKNKEKEDLIVAKKSENYEEKYMDKYKKMESVELSKEKLDSLKNAILFENTPNGNVIMFYDHSRGSFAYYTDNTIPYRFLEVIARKYVVVNNCKSIYIDMEHELAEAERRLKEKKQQKEEEEKRQKEENSQKTLEEQQQQNNKNVFAKFKTYNKDSSIQSASVPKDKPTTHKNTQPEIDKIVKDNANRYSCEGKIANFNFLKKVDRKVVDKRYGTSFSDFKKVV